MAGVEVGEGVGEGTGAGVAVGLGAGVGVALGAGTGWLDPADVTGTDADEPPPVPPHPESTKAATLATDARRSCAKLDKPLRMNPTLLLNVHSGRAE